MRFSPVYYQKYWNIRFLLFKVNKCREFIVVIVLLTLNIGTEMKVYYWSWKCLRWQKTRWEWEGVNGRLPCMRWMEGIHEILTTLFLWSKSLNINKKYTSPPSLNNISDEGDRTRQKFWVCGLSLGSQVSRDQIAVKSLVQLRHSWKKKKRGCFVVKCTMHWLCVASSHCSALLSFLLEFPFNFCMLTSMCFVCILEILPPLFILSEIFCPPALENVPYTITAEKYDIASTKLDELKATWYYGNDVLAVCNFTTRLCVFGPSFSYRNISFQVNLMVELFVCAKI